MVSLQEEHFFFGYFIPVYDVFENEGDDGKVGKLITFVLH